MQKPNKLVVIGSGGHAKVIIDAMGKEGKCSIFGIVDSKLKKGSAFIGIPVLGSDEILEGIFEKGVKYAFIAVGSIGNCLARKDIYTNLKRIGYRIPSVVHPAATMACDVSMDEGSFIAAGAVVNPGARIGKNVIINMHQDQYN